jgi:acyl carrier protein
MMESTAQDVANIEALKEMLTDVLDIDEEFSVDDHFMEDLGLSSLMALEVLVALEKEYQVKFKEEEMSELTSVSKVYNALKGKNANFH